MNGFFRKIPTLKKYNSQGKMISRNHMGIWSLGAILLVIEWLTHPGGHSPSFLQVKVQCFVFLKQFPGSFLCTCRNWILEGREAI